MRARAPARTPLYGSLYSQERYVRTIPGAQDALFVLIPLTRPSCASMHSTKEGKLCSNLYLELNWNRLIAMAIAKIGRWL
jgi:hypothetical protein